MDEQDREKRTIEKSTSYGRMKTTIGSFVMSGKKGMKKYPIWRREKIFEEIKEGKSQNQISKEYGISRYAIQSLDRSKAREKCIAKAKRKKTGKNIARIQI